MTTVQDEDQDEKARTDLRDSRLKLATTALGGVTALITLTATILGFELTQSKKEADTAIGKADASSAQVMQLQQENADLQKRLTAAQQALDELEASPSASAEAPAADVVYLDGLSANESQFQPTSATVRGISYEHALTTPAGCQAFESAQRSSADYAISAKKLMRFRADVLLSEDVDDRTVLIYYVRINGKPVAQGNVEPGKVVTVDRTVKEAASTVTIGFISEDCPVKRGEGIWANARLTRA